MAKYRVKSLEIQGIGKRILKGGETITEKDLPEGHAQIMAKHGHIELLGQNNSKKENEKKPVENSKSNKAG